MKRTSLFLFTSVLFLSFYGCEEDNFDLTTEIEGPREPVVVEETIEPFFRYRPVGEEFIETQGRAVLGLSPYLVISTAPEGRVWCNSNGSVGVSSQGGGIIATVVSPLRENPILSTVFAKGVVEGTTSGFAVRNRRCETISPELNIKVINDTLVAGTILIEFFDNTVASPSPVNIPCDSITSLGIFEFDFATPLTRCQ